MIHSKFLVTLFALLIASNSFSQVNDSVKVYAKGKIIRSFQRNKIDSITYSKTGVDGKLYPDYVTQIFSVSGTNYSDALSAVDSVKLGNTLKKEIPAEAIDLGLSVKWAGWNIGSSAVEEVGDYYAWGELDAKSNYDRGDAYKMVGLNTDIYATEHDVARVKWGNDWRMPTYKEMLELFQKCKYQWTTYKGMNGLKLTGPNGNTIFLPAAGVYQKTKLVNYGTCGFYFSGSIDADDKEKAYIAGFDSNYAMSYGAQRYEGRPIRAVMDK